MREISCFGERERERERVLKSYAKIQFKIDENFKILDKSLNWNLVYVWIRLMAFAFHPCVFSLPLFFFFFSPATIVDFSSVNSTRVHYSRDPQTPLFNNIFIKNRSHGTIHTFKNYFATVFSVFNFQFSTKISCIQTDLSLIILSSLFFCVFFLLHSFSFSFFFL